MRKTRFSGGIAVALFAGATLAQAQTVMMSTDWAAQACDAWNADPVLTGGLIESEWINNDNDRGYKVLHVYRTDCEESPRVEMRIEAKEGLAKCVYGGQVEKDPDLDVDYVMHAKTKRWVQMGAGEYGPMWAMMTFRLKFKGPKMEAMNNMGPFKNFLLLVGKVPAGTDTCP